MARCEDSGDQVTVTTIHQAKGLEWPCVFITWLNNSYLPSFWYQRADGDEEMNAKRQEYAYSGVTISVILTYIRICREAIEEERRLFYVALTRAKDTLHLSYLQRDRGSQKEPSMFLSEIPGKCLEVFQTTSPAKKHQPPQTRATRNTISPSSERFRQQSSFVAPRRIDTADRVTQVKRTYSGDIVIPEKETTTGEVTNGSAPKGSASPTSSSPLLKDAGIFSAEKGFAKAHLIMRLMAQDLKERTLPNARVSLRFGLCLSEEWRQFERLGGEMIHLDAFHPYLTRVFYNQEVGGPRYSTGRNQTDEVWTPQSSTFWAPSAELGFAVGGRNGMFH